MSKPKAKYVCIDCGAAFAGRPGRKKCDDCKVCCPDHDALKGGCNACDLAYRRWEREKFPGRKARQQKRIKYNLTDKELDELESIEACEACGKHASLYVDHDHACCPGQRTCGKCIRGMICQGCNTALGHVKDDPIVLQNLINYLKERG